jgi:hypothetical protein
LKQLELGKMPADDHSTFITNYPKGLAPSLMAPRGVIQALNKAIVEGQKSGAPFFPEDQISALFSPNWGKAKSNGGTLQYPSFCSFLSATLRWGLALSSNPNGPFSLGQFLNHYNILLSIANKEGVEVAIAYSVLLRKEIAHLMSLKGEVQFDLSKFLQYRQDGTNGVENILDPAVNTAHSRRPVINYDLLRGETAVDLTKDGPDKVQYAPKTKNEVFPPGRYSDTTPYPKGQGPSLGYTKKTPVCHFFKKGTCTYGDKCKFTHEAKQVKEKKAKPDKRDDRKKYRSSSRGRSRSRSRGRRGR